MQESKLELVKKILQNDIDGKDEKELLNLLVEKPLAINVDKCEKTKFGDKVADKFTKFAGSWTFIISFIVFMISWIILNIFILTKGFDEYPFILLNLMLSCISALQAPIIMMSQNRAAKKESLRNDNDYRIDLKSELILEIIYNKLNQVIDNQEKINKKIKMLEKESK